MAKRNYSDKLRIQLSSRDSASVWKGLKEIQLQDTIPHHSGGSTTGRLFEWVLFQVLKNTPHPPWTPLHTTINTFNTSSNPSSPPHLQFRSAKIRCARSSGSRKEIKHQAQTALHQSVWNPVLTSWSPSSQRSSTNHWNRAKVPSCFKCSTIIPIPK